MKAVILALFTR